MKDLRTLMKEEAIRCSTILYQLNAAADLSLPGGLMRQERPGNSVRYYHRYMEMTDAGKKRICQRLAPQDLELIRTLRANGLLRTWKNKLETNVDMLNQAAEKYSVVDLQCFAGIMPLQNLTAGAGVRDYFIAGLSWEDLKRSTAQYRPEEKIYEAVVGNFRSKGEMMHAMCFQAREIEYIYEPVVRIDGITLHPDFAVRNKRTGRIYFWEYFGMMDVEEYQQSFGRKMQALFKLGIIPGYSLICTCEFRGICELSTADIYAKIDAYLM